MLRLFQKTMLGQINDSHVHVADIKGYEVVVLSIIVILIILIGVLPNGLLHLSEASVSQLLQQIK
jgi:NADH-quinone oxidoreductase subunit M